MKTPLKTHFSAAKVLKLEHESWPSSLEPMESDVLARLNNEAKTFDIFSKYYIFVSILFNSFSRWFLIRQGHARYYHVLGRKVTQNYLQVSANKALKQVIPIFTTF